LQPCSSADRIQNTHMSTESSALPSLPAPVSPASGLIEVFTNPAVLFTRLRDRPDWILPLLVLCVFSMGIFFFLFPYMGPASLKALPDNASAQQIAAIRQYWTGYPKWSLLFAPIGVTLGILVSAGILTALVAMFSGKAQFKPLFSAVLYAKLVTIPAGILTALVVYLRGHEAVQTMMDVQWTISPAAFIPTENKTLFALLSQFSLFEFWYIALLVIAVQKIAGAKRGTSIVAVAIMWALGAVVMVGMSSFR
jgi:hypothetical protein